MLQICFPIYKGSVAGKHFPLAAWYLFLELNSCFISFYASRTRRGHGRTRGWALQGATCFLPPFISPRQALQTCPAAFPMGSGLAGRLTGPVVYRGTVKDQRGCPLSACVPAWYSPQCCCPGASPGQVGAIPSSEPIVSFGHRWTGSDSGCFGGQRFQQCRSQHSESARVLTRCPCRDSDS